LLESDGRVQRELVLLNRKSVLQSLESISHYFLGQKGAMAGGVKSGTISIIIEDE